MHQQNVVNPETESLFQLMFLNKFLNMLAEKPQRCTESAAANGKKLRVVRVKRFAKLPENLFVYTQPAPAHLVLLSLPILRGNANLKTRSRISKHLTSFLRSMMSSKIWNVHIRWIESFAAMLDTERPRSLFAQHLKRCKMESK